MSKMTPMIEQYWKIKKEHEDKILFFRVGDFYEMFFEDAKIAARELEIILTSRETGKGNHVPLAGIPYHAVNTYIARFIEKGYKIAICDQVEDARQAKGLVKRDVTRVITPGTILEDNLFKDSANNYLSSVYMVQAGIGLAIMDVSTGEFLITQLCGDAPLEKLKDELLKYSPTECIVNASAEANKDLQTIFSLLPHMLVSINKDHNFHYSRAYEVLTSHFHTITLEGYGCNEYPLAISAGGAILSYIGELYRSPLKHVNSIKVYNPENFMMIDGVTRRNLELTQTIRTGKKKGSLLGIMDKTITSSGARLLRKWLEQPLINKEKIEERIKGVEELIENPFIREDLKELLEKVYDLERIISRVSFGTAGARDLIHLKKTLKVFPRIKEIISQPESKIYQELKKEFFTLEDLHSLIENALVDDPPISLKEGGLIKEGFDKELDEMRDITRKGKKWIIDLEEKERKNTGIKSLKVSFNKVFGYYIEVTKANLSLAPDYYIRKQTLVNSERFITPELKEYEEKILDAEEKMQDREFQLFDNVRKKVAERTLEVQKSSKTLAVLDCLLNNARLALENDYCRPIFNENDSIKLKDGRHPVVEKFIEGESFVPNDTLLDNTDSRLLIITGPNMAGKSTYMRQVALISLMAQMGSFVPAREASLSLVDRIFARVGAADDLVGGQSTFMVEMNEVANILNNATRKSLVILDEIGRGTSTFDGMSIAQAVIEYLYDDNLIGSKALFATHYHELTELGDRLHGIKNYSMAVKEEGEDIVFLRKIIPEKADRSYGIQVARLAGLPSLVVQRASEILNKLERGKEVKRPEEKVHNNENYYLYPKDGLKELLGELESMDPLNMTPLEALNRLFILCEKGQQIKDGKTKKGGNLLD
ncbi:MAG: DNA mismatch repair protein MutS [Candidatus Syntrophonatronum acetioxidans]|uniref:DNA mismatch repair protein MutS n=1 Tax=Candidatus Syntrophonatronum acetioxidans TaxID=1795816 RepID=A0A424YE10_9FIRM|nr:MAG: DNA mismatch repair protein MutS [Candidatus Syntrophonatronum acetioxidans]